jgi:hypothetical protein
MAVLSTIIVAVVRTTRAGEARGSHLLSPFALFQPETRDFFLQDVATFEFGGRGFTTGFNYPYPADNAQSFFSRNIGLANGMPVSVIGCTKLSGELGGLGVGRLSVVTNGTGTTKRSQVLNVGRVTLPFGESKADIIFTNGDPSGLTENTLAGADVQCRDSDFLPGKILQADVYYQRKAARERHLCRHQHLVRR